MERNLMSAPAAAQAELTPTGKLRVGINFGNELLTVPGTMNDPEPRGIALDLARELARRLGVAVEFHRYPSAGATADSVRTGVWDVAFLGAEPQRANEMTFTAPYLEIEATYLVPPGSPLKAVADVDRAGHRIAITAKSAYDLYLSRNLRHATLVREQNADAALELFMRDKLDALASLKPRLVADAHKFPGSRILDGRFTAVQQAVATPKGRDAAAHYLREFVEDVKASGLVARTIEQNNVRGVSVAPAAPVR
jgi:polar amino acid transport system substrate-binding protein